MPDMMSGLVETFHHTNVHKKSSHAAMPAAVMTSSTRQLMRNRLGLQIILYNLSHLHTSILEPEYQVYNYVKERLLRQYEACTNTAQDK